MSGNPLARKAKSCQKVYMYLSSLRLRLRIKIRIEKDSQKKDMYVEDLSHVEKDMARIKSQEFKGKDSYFEELEDIVLFYRSLKL